MRRAYIEEFFTYYTSPSTTSLFKFKHINLTLQRNFLFGARERGGESYMKRKEMLVGKFKCSKVD